MRRTEDFHHSPEQVGVALDAALAILDARELSGEERCAALPALLTLLAAKHIVYEQPQPVMLDPRLHNALGRR